MLVPAPLSADPIRHALAVTRGHVGDAAKLLGVSRPTLYDRAKKIGMALADEAAAQKAVMAGEHNTVTLSMQDYLSLRAAAIGHQDALTKAESMIDHLTRKYLDLLTHMKACGVSIAASVLLCLFVAVPAAAQSSLPDHVYRTLVEVCAEYPYQVVQSDEHLGEILNEVAYRHRDEGWGLSRKTGGQRVGSPVGEIAEDILQLPSGFHYDVLTAAKVGNPLLPNQGSNIGVIDLRNRPWVAPVAHRLSWKTGVTPGPDPVKPPPVVTPPATTDLTPVLTALARLQADVDELKNRPQPDPAPPDLGLVNEYVDDMIGNGPDGATDNHVTDVKKRLDALRVTLEQLNAWLRSRRALSW